MFDYFLCDEEPLTAFEQEKLSEKMLEDRKTQGRENGQELSLLFRQVGIV